MIPLNSKACAADAQESRIDLAVDADQHAGLVRSVCGQVPGISREDAEDAVQDAWIVLAEKADRLEPGPIGGYLRGTARNKAMKIREKGRRTTSLEALAETAGDGTRALIDPLSESLQSHAELDELIDDPVARRAVEAAEMGAAPCVAPRGMSHRAARYTDRQVEEVRELRRQGHTFREIEARTGVPAGYGPALAGARPGSPGRATAGPGRSSSTASAGSRGSSEGHPSTETRRAAWRCRHPTRSGSSSGRGETPSGRPGWSLPMGIVG